jgi:lactoylglutathione lyase
MEFSLTHVRLLVKRYPECYAFYKDLLGLTPACGDTPTGYAEFEAGGPRLAIFDRWQMASVLGTSGLPSDYPLQDHVVVILRVENVDKTVEMLKARGVEPVTDAQDRKEWKIRTAHFRDPDGNLIEINSRIE